MNKNRVEAFSDGVIAIIITIMVLELRAPDSGNLSALVPLIPVFLSYGLSFVFVGIYWNNHHHLFQAVRQVSGAVLWANLHLLFWLSLFPFATAWVGRNSFAAWPVLLYGLVLFMAGVAYFILVRILLAIHATDSILAAAIHHSSKEVISIVIYGAAILLVFLNSWLAFGLYVLVAIIWLIPDRRIEKLMSENKVEE